MPVRWSCRTGVCHNCESTLIAGGVDYDPDPVEPPAEGSVLICCSRPHDDLVFAVAVAAWQGERGSPFFVATFGPDLPLPARSRWWSSGW